MSQIFDTSFETSHKTFITRMNELFSLTGNMINVQVEFTYAMLSFTAAAITFITMKNSVNFAFYFFVMSRTASQSSQEKYLEAASEGHRFKFKTLMRMNYFNFISPLLVCMLFVKELTTEPLKQYLGVEPYIWEVVRMIIIVLVLQPKLMLFREELQFLFD